MSNNTAKAAEQVHEQINGKVYVIGITNQTELLAIAMEGEFTYLDTFNRNVLIQHHIDSVCEKGRVYTCKLPKYARGVGAQFKFNLGTLYLAGVVAHLHVIAMIFEWCVVLFRESLP